MNILDINYEKYSLPNGLEVILYKDDSLPLVAANIWYRVGSADEKKGKTGIAHLFEHMMFQGSQNVPKEMHFKYIQEAGGALNGSTSFDRTNYYEKVPSNFLDLILWLEADRMGFWLPALTMQKLDNQKDVVKNERLERYENQPYGLAWEIMLKNLYDESHPYSWPTIGSLEDIANFTMEDVRGFFKKYYSPSNACLVIAGDFDSNEAKESVEKYFGPINGNGLEKTVHEPGRQILKSNKLLIHKDNVQLDRLYLAWHSDKAYGEHDRELDILSDILSGSKNSRLYKSLVFEKEAAQDVMAYQFSGGLAGFFMLAATAKPGVDLNYLKEEVLKAIKKIGAEGVSREELLKSKNGIKSGFVYSLQNLDSIADQINSYNFYLREPNSFRKDLERYEKVTNEGIMRCVEKYLTKNYVELHIIPNNQKQELNAGT